MAKNKNVIKIGLKCTETGRINYTVTKNRRNTQEKLELMKFCPALHKHTLHRETKLK